MSKEFTKEDVILNKKEAIRSLNKLLEAYIASPAEKHIKKAHLISYWIKDYTKFLDFEEKFDPTRNIAYKRGNIVKVNFGFNIGSEYGGLHFGVVLDNHNDHSSPVLTVIPLTSLKENKTIHANSVNLGNELYSILQEKLDKEKQKLKQILDELDKIEDIPINIQNIIEKEKKYIEKMEDEISKMKQDSIALINQITTISKQRIFKDTLRRNVKLSNNSLDLIDEQIIKYFTK